ncbi:FKBP-type peptidyl-prolyl cis-trans isomerase [Guillardia theta CCMP2712]|uniref:peptidylprolyl isomerase n=1 Tax=Guillardia theta (strain CCMP2712) TaxID=905079 RepID=L1JEN4_GUITC|nr:FKBP-type peptidyl-prolyl cis-trans isomerase [Guillardia theta CCMP2712]EKX46570.1 FKBP-type peptidyl-prolyl cis-trans isomerase [Guillardia theta CCMP2712]|eukprot:XP_005833550.1 FKBP-type peptidyl-prolyl cis-trans isomerase [Guillardia theta CCMP2712]
MAAGAVNVSLIVLLLAVVHAGDVARSQARIKEATKPEVLADIKASSNIIKLSNGLTIEILMPGKGEEAEAGDRVRVEYSQYMESCDASEPTCKLMLNQKVNSGTLDTKLGSGKLQPGLEQGIVGMKVGEKRTIHVPPELAFGDNPHPPFPAHSGFKYQLQLLSVCGPNDPFMKSLLCSLGFV